MSYRGYMSSSSSSSTIDDARNEWSRVLRIVSTNVQKITQNVNQMKRLVNQLGSSQDTDTIRSNLQEVQTYTNQLAKDTTNYLKELSQLPQSTNISEQIQRRMFKEKITNELSAALNNFEEIQRVVKDKESLIRVRANSEINCSNISIDTSLRGLSSLNDSRRSTFSVEKFMSPSSVISRPQSAFYEGRTVFGGTNNSRSARLAGTTPYSLSHRNRLAPMVNVKPNKRVVATPSDELSASSRRILESLEKASTPIQDAKRQPYSSRSELKDYFHSSNYLFRSSKRQKTGPPTSATPLVTQTTIDSRFTPQKYELKLIHNTDTNKPSTLKTTDELIAAAVNEDKKYGDNFGGKIMANKQRRDERRGVRLQFNDNQLEDDENLQHLSTVEPLVMPTGATLPTFTFGKSMSSAGQKSVTPRATTTVTKVDAYKDESPVFTFTEPLLKRKVKKPSLKTSDEVDKKDSFVFSSPSVAASNNKSLETNSTVLNSLVAQTLPTLLSFKSDRKPLATKPTIPSISSSTTSCTITTTFNGLDTISSTPSSLKITPKTSQMLSSPSVDTQPEKPKSEAQPKAQEPKPKLFEFGVPWVSSTVNTKSDTNTVTKSSPLVPNLKPTSISPKTMPQFGGFGVNTTTTTVNTEPVAAPVLSKPIKEMRTPTPVAANPAPSLSDAWGEKFKPASDTWSCPICCIINQDNQLRCQACEEPKPGGASNTKDTLSANNPSFGDISAFKSFTAPTVTQETKGFVFGSGSVKTSSAAPEAQSSLTATTPSFGGFGAITSPMPAVTQPATTQSKPSKTTSFGTTLFGNPCEPLLQSQSSTFNFGSTSSASVSTPTTTSTTSTFGGFGLPPSVTAPSTGVAFGGFGSTQSTTTAGSQMTSSAAPFVFGGSFGTNQSSASSLQKPLATTTASFNFGTTDTNTLTKSGPPPAFSFSGISQSTAPAVNQFQSQSQSTLSTKPTTSTFGVFGSTPAMPSMSTLISADSAATAVSKPESKLFQFGVSAQSTATSASKETQPIKPFSFGGVSQPTPSTATSQPAAQSNQTPFAFGGFSGSTNQSVPTLQSQPKPPPFSFNGFGSTTSSAATVAPQPSVPQFTSQTQSTASATPFAFGGFGASQSSSATAVSQSQQKLPSFSFNGFSNTPTAPTGAPQFSTSSQPQSAAPTAPFAFGSGGAFGAIQSAPTPASVPQFQSQPTQPLVQPPPQFNFSQQPSFDFASMASTGATAPASTPLFQFSAEPTTQTTTATNRFIKKAKRRLNPS